MKTEAELIASARAGDQDAFAALHKQLLPSVRAVGRAVLRTYDLDDLCQDTFLYAFTRIDSFQGNSNFRTWVTRIAMNQCLMVLRRNKQVTNGDFWLVRIDEESSDDLLDQCFFTVEDRNLRSVEARFDLPKYLSILRPEVREILEMAYLEEMPAAEIAERVGIAIASVKSKIHHSKRRLREARVSQSNKRT